MRPYCCTTDVVTRPLPQRTVRYPEFRDELLRLLAADQALRASDKFFPGDRDSIQELTRQEHERADRVLEILKIIKTPSARNIGLDGSRAVWLVALHNPTYRKAGQIILRKMQYLYARDRESVFYPGIPYLVDRLMVFGDVPDHNKKQLYGTQQWASVAPDGTCRQGVFPVIDSKNLASRRHKFGLAGPGDNTECMHRI